MAFSQGIFDAPAIELAPCGLLSVARVVTTTKEEWLRGYSYNVVSMPEINILNRDNAAVTNGTLTGTPSTTPTFFPSEGFVVEAVRTQSAMGSLGEDPQGFVDNGLAAALQKAAEYELWEGVALLAGSSGGIFLRIAGTPVVGNAAGQSAAIALRHLEQAISLSPFGGRGIIHMTRDVASELGNRLLYKGDGDSATEDRAITRLGTRVVIGSGYTGNGPIGATGETASATNKWMFATSAVDLVLGPKETVVQEKSGGFDPEVNDIVVVVQQSAAVHFDPSIHYAARVTLPTA